MQRNPKFLRRFFPFFLAVLLVACHHNEDVTPTPVVLVDSDLTLAKGASELRSILGLSGLDIPLEELEFDVDLYKVTYNTTFKGQNVVASGLVILPKTSTEVGMVSFQHGTITSHAEAPSALGATSTELILYAALASPGFIAVVPDFLGFGSSVSMLHPYYVKDATSASIIDLLKAAKELATLKGVKFNGKLALAGYSEGGYATMAAHREIEESGLDGFTLVASFPASGGYDVKGMQEYFFGLITYDDPFYLAYVSMSYGGYYDWNQTLSGIFQEPYAALIPNLFDGSKSGSQINAQLTDSVANFVDPELLANIDTDDQYQDIVDAFHENSLLDWKPTIRMFMYHGDADITVPYQNSVDTYNQLIANGAATEILTLTAFHGKTHSTGVSPYIEAIIPELLDMR